MRYVLGMLFLSHLKLLYKWLIPVLSVSILKPLCDLRRTALEQDKRTGINHSKNIDINWFKFVYAINQAVVTIKKKMIMMRFLKGQLFDEYRLIISNVFNSFVFI
ncbi:hypothetical protein SCARR_02819 [Pontiella sulfatireligans]|uniref:Uncharacterized protein n=1 Tax=Pontiella sulfatireligans TaxID=2750658 RepID=A0A6C2UKI9_9BACT|nr:hypothetical protein SCARR_02819 [Pontiella sulfatireligans]